MAACMESQSFIRSAQSRPRDGTCVSDVCGSAQSLGSCRNRLEQETLGDLLFSQVRSPKEIQEFSTGTAQPQGGLAALHPQSLTTIPRTTAKLLQSPTQVTLNLILHHMAVRSQPPRPSMVSTRPAKALVTSEGLVSVAPVGKNASTSGRSGSMCFLSMTKSSMTCPLQGCVCNTDFYQGKSSPRLLPTTPSTVTDECELVGVTCLKALTLKMRNWV